MKTRTFQIYIRLFLLSFVLLLVSGQKAFADCSSPAGPAGMIVYNEDNSVLQWCDGADWIGLPQSFAGFPIYGNGGTNDYFGQSVDVSGGLMIIGEPGYGSFSKGRARIYTALGEFIANLDNPTSTTTYDWFGRRVALSGSVAVVGADQDESDGESGVGGAGRAYVFYENSGSWVAGPILNNPAPEATDRFGESVALSGTTAVIGTPYDDPGGVGNAGTVYVFDTVTGNLLHTLNNPSPNANDYFGIEVAISGSTIVIGAYNDESDGTTGTTDAGRVYVFDASTGNLVAVINNPNPTGWDDFGNDVDTDGTNVIVGAWHDEADGTTGIADAGRAYVFDAMTGNLISILNHPYPDSGDQFGSGVAIYGTTAVVASPIDEFNVNEPGRVFLFDISTNPGTLIREIDNPAPVSVYTSFGAIQYRGGVSLSGNKLLIGSGINTSNYDGVAYLYDLSTPCQGGSISYNDNLNVLQWCNGTNWVAFPKNTGTLPTWNLVETLINPTPAEADYYGYSVSISADIALVGALNEKTSSGSSGKVYVYNKKNGTLIDTWEHPSPSAFYGEFGHIVDVDGNVAVVGDPDFDVSYHYSTGIAYVFDVGAGNLIATLNNPSPAEGEDFGYSVAVSGTTVVVGNRYDSPGGVISAGTAYVFDATTGNLTATLNNPAPTQTDFFGSSVAVSGNIALVSAPGDDPGAVNDAGTVYVFDTTTGNLTATLNNPDPTDLDRMGYGRRSVALEGTTAVVGVAFDDPSGVTGGGSVYVFDTATGNLLQTINNPNSLLSDGFGSSVDVSGTTIVIGATGGNLEGISSAGSAYIFDTSGNYISTIRNPNPEEYDLYGVDVSIDGNSIIVGGYQISPSYPDNDGTAYIFSTIPDCPRGDAGSLVYNQDFGIMQWCDGERWHGLKLPTTKTVFVSSTAGKGNWKGGVLADYDAECQSLAVAAGLSGTYKAWISNSTSSVASRFSKPLANYVLVDGTVVASGYYDLTDGTLDSNINKTEIGATYTGPIWTGTTIYGATDDDTCSDWTSGGGGSGSGAEGSGGDIGSGSNAWTAVYGTYGNYKCGSSLPIYCFEQ